MQEKPELTEYEHYIDDIQRMKPHTLSTEEEELVAEAGLMSGTAYDGYSIFKNADMPRPTITMGDGKDARLNDAGYTLYRADTDRDVRKRVFEEFCIVIECKIGGVEVEGVDDIFGFSGGDVGIQGEEISDIFFNSGSHGFADGIFQLIPFHVINSGFQGIGILWGTMNDHPLLREICSVLTILSGFNWNPINSQSDALGYDGHAPLG